MKFLCPVQNCSSLQNWNINLKYICENLEWKRAHLRHECSKNSPIRAHLGFNSHFIIMYMFVQFMKIKMILSSRIRASGADSGFLVS